MARMKKPEGETPEQTKIRHIMETISGAATRNEKVSWGKKLENMEQLMDQLEPIEQQIVELMDQKAPILDGIMNLRQEMVQSCVHPYTHLVYKENYVVCKFCYKKFIVNNTK